MLGVLGTGAAYVLNYRLIADDGATSASVVTYLLPVVAIVFGVAVADERMSAHVVLGVGVVLLGVGLVRRKPAQPHEHQLGRS